METHRTISIGGKPCRIACNQPVLVINTDVFRSQQYIVTDAKIYKASTDSCDLKKNVNKRFNRNSFCCDRELNLKDG